MLVIIHGRESWGDLSIRYATTLADFSYEYMMRVINGEQDKHVQITLVDKCAVVTNRIYYDVDGLTPEKVDTVIKNMLPSVREELELQEGYYD